MTYRERVNSYLQSIAPQAAGNKQIAASLGVRWHASVFRATRQLAAEGAVQRERQGRQWLFRAMPAPAALAEGAPSTPAAEVEAPATEGGPATSIPAQPAQPDLRRALLRPLLDLPEGRVWFLDKLRCPCSADEARAAVVSFRRRPLRDLLERDWGLFGGSPEGQARLESTYNAVFNLPDDCGVAKVWRSEAVGSLRLPLAGRENAWTAKLLRKHIARKRYLRRAQRAMRLVQTRVDALIMPGSCAVLVRCAQNDPITERQYVRLKELGGALERRWGKRFFLAGVVNNVEQLGVLDLAHVTWDELRAWLAAQPSAE